MPPKVTAKAPNLGSVQVDSKEWVKVSGEQMQTLKLGDLLEASNAKADAPVAEAAKPAFVAKESTAKLAGNGLSFAEKDSRILIQGLVQAVLQSPLMNMIPDGVAPLAFVEKETVALADMVKRLSGTK